MFCPHRREQVVCPKVFGRHHAEPKGGVCQTAMDPGKPFVGHKAGGIDQDFARIEFRLQIFREDFERGKVRLCCFLEATFKRSELAN